MELREQCILFRARRIRAFRACNSGLSRIELLANLETRDNSAMRLGPFEDGNGVEKPLRLSWYRSSATVPTYVPTERVATVFDPEQLWDPASTCCQSVFLHDSGSATGFHCPRSRGRSIRAAARPDGERPFEACGRSCRLCWYSTKSPDLLQPPRAAAASENPIRFRERLGKCQRDRSDIPCGSPSHGCRT